MYRFMHRIIKMSRKKIELSKWAKNKYRIIIELSNALYRIMYRIMIELLTELFAYIIELFSAHRLVAVAVP